MRVFTILVMSAVVFSSAGALANASNVQADLPGDRADIVARELMSPF